jgi:selenocysteine lyase/cysteine desulfurase
MATLPLPARLQSWPHAGERFDPLQAELYARTKIEVPIVRWGAPSRRWVRISVQAYNTTGEYYALAEALARL